MSLVNAIPALRKAGYKVRVSHYRYALIESSFTVGSRTLPIFTEMLCLSSNKEVEGLDIPVITPNLALPYGGYTTVNILTPSGDEFEGVAECSLKDNYNRKLGLHIATARAMKSMGVAIVKDAEGNCIISEVATKA